MKNNKDANIAYDFDGNLMVAQNNISKNNNKN